MQIAVETGESTADWNNQTEWRETTKTYEMEANKWSQRNLDFY